MKELLEEVIIELSSKNREKSGRWMRQRRALQAQGITYFAHEDKLLSGTSGGCKLFNISQGGKEAEDKPLKVGKRSSWSTL